MAEVVYRAEIPLTRVKGALRLAYLPAESEPVRFGTHGAIARHYGIEAEVLEAHATTIDYLIGAAGGDCSAPSGRAGGARDRCDG